MLICLLAFRSGVDRLPRESKGGTRAYEEPNGDEQDPEARQCWNCPSQMKLRAKTWYLIGWLLILAFYYDFALVNFYWVELDRALIYVKGVELCCLSCWFCIFFCLCSVELCSFWLRTPRCVLRDWNWRSGHLDRPTLRQCMTRTENQYMWAVTMNKGRVK